MAQIRHACPKPNRGELPFIIHDAAVKGNTSEVLNWLDKGGDINAADMNDCTLLFTACNNNHVQLLKELLKYPNVHLNQLKTNAPNFSVFSLLGIACQRGYSDCMEALITSPSECRVDLETVIGVKGKIVIAVAQQNRWDIVELILKTDYVLEENDACVLMNMAVKVNEMDIIRNIMKRESILYKTQLILNVLLDIYKRNKWDEVNCNSIFSKTVFNDNDCTKNILLLVLENKDWNRLEILLRIMKDDVKINVSLAEAISKKASTDVERILAQEHLEGDDVMNGALLVASIGGTSEQIVDMLFAQKHNYSDEILDEAFMLTSRFNRLELLPTLLRRGSFSYKTLCRARSSTNYIGVLDLLNRALKKAAKEIVPLDEEDDKDEK